MTTGYLIAEPLWVAAGWTIFHFLWIGAGIGLIALFGRHALGSARPEARYAFALFSLLAMAVAPMAIFIWVFDPSPTDQSIGPNPLSIRAGTKPDMNLARGLAAESTRIESALETVGSPTFSPDLAAGTWRSLANPVVMVLPWLWLAGSPLTFALLASGLIGAERFRRQSQRIESGEIVRLCQSLTRSLRLTREVAVGVCDRLVAPVLIGVIRPMILLPPAALNGWTIEQLEMVLWHELAHVRRWDNLVNLLQRVVESLLFFHPAVWWVSGWARLERELCCDLLVVTRTGRARAYAEALSALAEVPAPRWRPAALAIAENQVVLRIRRVLDIEAHATTMRLSRWTVGGAATLALAPVLLIGSYARSFDEPTANRPSRVQLAQVSATTTERDVPTRQRRHAEAVKAAVRQHDLNEPEWRPGPIPDTVPVKVSGRARDEQGNPVAHAVILLYSAGMLETKLLGQATTDASGNYLIAARLPVVTKHFDLPLLKEITPYAPFVVCGLAPGRGLAWSDSTSMYALAEPNPDDIQGRLPLGRPVELDLWFPKATTLTGRVVDEAGKPIAGCKVQITFANLLDDKGQETTNFAPNVWRALPGSIGLGITDGEGRFLLDRLPDRALFHLNVQRREAEHTFVRLYAATIDKPRTGQEQHPPEALGVGLPHKAKTGDLEIVCPELRRVLVSVFGDDTDKPVAGIDVYSINERVRTTSLGDKTDAAGTVALWLPMGESGVIRAEPPIQSGYIRTEEGAPVVEPRLGEQSHHFLLNSGSELLIEAVEAGTNKPVSDACFWKVSTEDALQREPINPSPSLYCENLTNANGTLRAVFTPEPRKRYRFEFAGIHQPNVPSAFTDPKMTNKHGYSSQPAASDPVELKAGATIRLRFVLSKEK
jgi:beta-lactamase regulating signal transducer with metallopeptidase domain